MSRVYHSGACPFSFGDWRFKKINKLFAGNSCVMAITDKGTVLQKVADENLSAKTKYWTNIKSISISQFFPALAVGLVNDGTCIVSKSALRNCCQITGNNFIILNEKIKALTNIVEIVVSDAIFALDTFGKVHHIALWTDDDYTEVDTWKSIKHISTGNQNSVFGITSDNTVVCTGTNCKKGPLGNLQGHLSDFSDVVDICAMGSACENVILALSNGTIVDFKNNNLNFQHIGESPVFYSNYLFCVARLKNNRFKPIPYNSFDNIALKYNMKVRTIAIGTDDSFEAFCIWSK